VNGPPFVILFASQCVRLLVVLAGSALKASLIFTVVYLATRLLRDSRPGQRHLLWCGAVYSYLLILLLSLIGLPVLPLRRPLPSGTGVLSRAVSTLLLSPRAAPVIGASSARAASATQAAPGLPDWALPLALLWAAGTLASLLQLGVGAARLRLLLAQAGRRGARPAPRLADLCRQLSTATGVRRTVRVVVSPGCQVPFAAGTLRPLLVLPSSAGDWPRQRLRAALLHELRHIRRLDPLTQTLSRLVCCLFWFVPLVWIAHWFLYLEQEKACDASAVENGVPPRDYAACLLFAARRLPEPSTSAGLYSPLWRRRILEDRIRHVVAPGPAVRHGRLVLAIAALAVLVLALQGVLSARGSLSYEEAYQRFVGTWATFVPPGTQRSRVTVIRPDYIAEDRHSAFSTVLDGLWSIEVRKTWIDDRGNTYCQFLGSYVEGSTRQFAGLMRVDEKGKVRELITGDTTAYPERIDPNHPSYCVYYRKK
jgi:beta-lactamase regulating signal transducer with metallopeptidase domain